MKDIYSKDGIVQTFQEGNIIKVIWSKLHEKESLYASCEAQLKAVKTDGIEVIIIDISNASGTPPMEVQQWFGEVLFPGFSSSPDFKGLINILPQSAVTKMGAKHWKKTAESDQFGFMMFETDSMINAENLAIDMMNQEVSA